MSQSVPAIAPTLSVVDGIITTTSIEVARHFGKRHERVLDAARTLTAALPVDAQHNFVLSDYADSTGRTLPCYRMTRDGFTLLAMGFTGKKALQFKLAYIDAFNRMERELLARTTRPANPALDYDRISPAQAQSLKELVQAVVEAGAQGFGETWARLHRKFRVNNYLELPASQFDEACAYLRSKLPTGGLSLSALISAGNGVYIDTAELLRISQACIEKLASRAVFQAKRKEQA